MRVRTMHAANPTAHLALLAANAVLAIARRITMALAAGALTAHNACTMLLCTATAPTPRTATTLAREDIATPGLGVLLIVALTHALAEAAARLARSRAALRAMRMLIAGAGLYATQAAVASAARHQDRHALALAIVVARIRPARLVIIRLRAQAHAVSLVALLATHAGQTL